jgi:peptidoglycan/LPS O-acetylase OafA/YrhL
MRRALRIFPVYYLAVVACMVIFRFGTADAISLLTYTFNFYHPLHPTPNPLEHTWSLSVEEQFYLFWPLAILLVPPRWLNAVMGCIVPLLAVSSGLVLAIILLNDDARMASDVVYMSLFTRMLSLSLGGWLALREFENKPLRGWRCLALLVGGLFVITLDRLGRNHGIISSQPVYWTVALIGYVMISVSFIATMVFDRGLLQRMIAAFLSIPLMRKLGQMSYAMYVFHLPVLFYFGLNDAALNGAKVPVLQVCLALAITLALPFLSYHLLETPMAKLKESLGSTSLKSKPQQA